VHGILQWLPRSNQYAPKSRILQFGFCAEGRPGVLPAKDRYSLLFDIFACE